MIPFNPICFFNFVKEQRTGTHDVLSFLFNQIPPGRHLRVEDPYKL